LSTDIHNDGKCPKEYVPQPTCKVVEQFNLDVFPLAEFKGWTFSLAGEPTYNCNHENFIGPFGKK
jgi:hypothetical protein